MAQAHELVVVLAVGAQAAQGDGHAALQIPVQTGLGPVGLLKVVEELLGGGGELQLLGTALEIGPVLFDLLHGGGLALLELHKHGGHVAVQAGHPEALGGDVGAGGLDDLAVLHLAPDLQGLLLALLLLAADVGDDVVHHLGPALEGLARAGDGLIGAHQGLLNAVLHQGMEGGGVGLDGAVGLHCDEAALGAKALFLGGDDLQVLRVHLGHHHGHVLGPAVGGVVGHHRALGLGVGLLQGADLVLLHIHGTEHKVHQAGDLLDVRLGVQHHQVLGLLRDRSGHGPAVLHRLLIGLARGAGAGGDDGELEPGVLLHQGDEALAHHAGAADDSDFVLFHKKYLPSGSGHSMAPLNVRCPGFQTKPSEKKKSAAFQAADFVL